MSRSLWVPDEYPTIQAAIDAIPTRKSHMIRLAPGVYRENLVIRRGRKVALVAEDPNVTVIDGGRRGSVIRVGPYSDLFLYGVRLRNGRAHMKSRDIRGLGLRGCGGALCAWQARVTMSNCRVENNIAADSGGGVYTYQTVLNIGDVLFKNNRAPCSGGLNATMSETGITTTSFVGNKSDDVSGAFISGGKTTLRQVSFHDNESKEGNTLHIHDCNVWYVDLLLSGNKSGFGDADVPGTENSKYYRLPPPEVTPIPLFRR